MKSCWLRFEFNVTREVMVFLKDWVMVMFLLFGVRFYRYCIWPLTIFKANVSRNFFLRQNVIFFLKICFYSLVIWYILYNSFKAYPLHTTHFKSTNTSCNVLLPSTSWPHLSFTSGVTYDNILKTKDTSLSILVIPSV